MHMSEQLTLDIDTGESKSSPFDTTAAAAAARVPLPPRGSDARDDQTGPLRLPGDSDSESTGIEAARRALRNAGVISGQPIE